MSDCRSNRGHGWACGERVRLRRVFAKGTIDEPAGDCLHCHTVFYAAGFKDEFGSKEKFNVERDNDIALAGPFTKACALWLAARNERRRCRARSDGKRARSGNNLLSELQESRLGRKRILKTRQRNLKVKIPMKVYAFKNTIAQSGLAAQWHGTPDGPVWGVKARVNPKGEYDAEDEQVDGVEEETIDSGNEKTSEVGRERSSSTASRTRLGRRARMQCTLRWQWQKKIKRGARLTVNMATKMTRTATPAAMNLNRGVYLHSQE